MIKFYCITEESLIQNICDHLNISYDMQESYNLYEYHLPTKTQINPEDLLSEIDWDFILKNDKKIIITHTQIYHLKKYEKVLSKYIKKYNCKNNLWWYSFNPYEAYNKKINVAFLDPISHVSIEHEIITKNSAKDYSYKRINQISSCNLNKVNRYFISTNLSHNSHRILSNHLLNKKNLIKQGYYSFHASFLKDIKAKNTIKNNYLQDFKAHSEFLEKHSLNIKDIFIDIEKTHVLDRVGSPRVNLSLDSIQSFYEQSLVSLVTESTVDENEIFITEKTQMSFVYGRPFLLIGNRYSLKFLKQYYGFKTFDKIFDESYDNCNNFVEKTVKVIDELDRFCSLPFSKAKQKIQDISDILEYNREVYRKLDRSFLFKRTLTKVMEG